MDINSPQQEYLTAPEQVKLQSMSSTKQSHIKILFLIIIIFFTFATGLYVTSKYFYPIVTFLPQFLKPWSKTEGVACSFDGCNASEINQIYNYWLFKALQNKKPDLCNHTIGFETGDTGVLSKDVSTNYCKSEYSMKTGDVDLCKSLPAENMNLCLPEIVKSYSKPELFNREDCLRIESDKDHFAVCVLILASIKKNDRECQILSDRKMWRAYENCLQQSSIVEPRTDNARNEVTVSNFRQYIAKCNSYAFLKNRVSCFSDIIGSISGYQSQPKIIEDFCADSVIDESWSVCWFFPSFSGSKYSVFTRTEEIKYKGLSAARSNPTFKNNLCESLWWDTKGLKGISDTQLQDFAVNVCGLDYFRNF